RIQIEGTARPERDYGETGPICGGQPLSSSADESDAAVAERCASAHATGIRMPWTPAHHCALLDGRRGRADLARGCRRSHRRRVHAYSPFGESWGRSVMAT